MFMRGIMSDPFRQSLYLVAISLPISRRSSLMGRPEHYVEGHLSTSARHRGWTAKFTSLVCGVFLIRSLSPSYHLLC